MIEPEVAFCDLAGNMDLAEEFVKYLIRDAIQHCAGDLEFLANSSIPSCSRASILSSSDPFNAAATRRR